MFELCFKVVPNMSRKEVGLPTEYILFVKMITVTVFYRITRKTILSKGGSYNEAVTTINMKLMALKVRIQHGECPHHYWWKQGAFNNGRVMESIFG